jgi:amino acid transporter/nucleotide-binding universal stress UspA family protein
MLELKERPRELKWYHAAGMLFGDWGTSRLYVLGLAFVLSGHASFFFVAAMGVFMTLVGFCYSIICAHFPDGGGVYSAAKRRSPTLGVVGALLLSADYIITAALSAYEGFRYILPSHVGSVWALYLAVFSLLLVGAMNFFGPRRAGTFAFGVGLLSVALYVVLAGFCLPHMASAQIHIPHQAPEQSWFTFANVQWGHFVAVILALSGVEAIANMTGVMAEPVAKNSRRAIFAVLAEVVILNLIMAWAMNALSVNPAALAGDELKDHRDHMVKILAQEYVGPWFASVSSLAFGVLLISAANSAIGGLVSIQYLMSRDGELPRRLTSLNRYGMPWIALIGAVLAPAVVLLIVGDNLGDLADLYAIGVVGAISINLLACGTNAELGLKRWEKITLLAVGGVTSAIELTIAVDKPKALLFAGTVLGVGLLARSTARTAAERFKAVVEMVRPPALLERNAPPTHVPRVLVPTRGNPKLIRFAAQYAKGRGGAVFLLFIREVALTFRERGAPLAPKHMTVESDLEAMEILMQADEICKEAGVPMVPVYVVHDSPAEVILDYAATLGTDTLIMGVSRRGTVWRTFRGDVVQEVMRYLPESIPLLIQA